MNKTQTLRGLYKQLDELDELEREQGSNYVTENKRQDLLSRIDEIKNNKINIKKEDIEVEEITEAEWIEIQRKKIAQLKRKYKKGKLNDLEIYWLNGLIEEFGDVKI